MVATANGLDSRLIEAAQALLAAGRGSPTGQPMSLPAFLTARCRQLLEAFPTSVEEDAALLQRLQAGGEQAAAAAATAAGDGVRPQQLEVAVQYRLGKKRVLQATLQAMQGAA